MTGEALDVRTVTALVQDATVAPSMHNAQPWKFRFFRDSSTFHVRSDLRRTMPRADTTTRALHLGCGAVLFNLRVAAAHAGWEPETGLLPDPGDRQLLATVRLTEPAPRDSDLAALYSAIHRRRTSRHPFSDEEIPAAVKDELCAAAFLERARLLFPSGWHVESLLDLVEDAEGRDAMDPAATEDMVRWTRVGADAADGATDGIPDYAFGPAKRDGRAPVRDFAGRRAVAGRETGMFEDAPQLALLGTSDDRPTDWLHAGQALERVLLQATLDGLSTSLTSHALERPELRWAARDPRSTMGFVQMVLRLGYGAPPQPGPPRRPVREVLDIE
ncbi:Acg family FMN-binding oxidoreductase [Streptomyces lycii]|uniref:Nitroreductase n=1 Tax=Streptomyces lycii TaxID=2654337 RepID=A0ABQ7FC71_9ACTN|nr:nitroreductase family protein [Streptomyces lycii]KAF4405304.1 nitroreductase [Streptomyces lycii]